MVLVEHWDAAEADLHRHYGIDFDGAPNGWRSLRRLFNRVRHLPGDGAFWSAVREAKPPVERDANRIAAFFGRMFGSEEVNDG